MSEAKVTIERKMPGTSKKETKEVSQHFYNLLNPNPDYNGGWKLAAPKEVEDSLHAANAEGLRLNEEGTDVAEGTSATTDAGQPKAKDSELGKQPLVDEGKDTTPAPNVATAPAKVAEAAPKTRRSSAEVAAEKAAKVSKAKAPAAEDLNKMS